jgi:8-oxo-dGTP pyrophosphatase MutT (NUDIX family)
VTHRLDLAAIRRALSSRQAREVDGSDTTRRAAVSIVLRAGTDAPEVLLVRRAEHPSDPWSGHMAFPGGRKQSDDQDLRSTAVRETSEEIGLDLERRGSAMGRLDDLPAIARGRPMGLVIAPFVFEVADELPSFTLNDEIAEALWTPLGPMFRGETATSIDYPWEGRTFTFPGYDVGGRTVWGLTFQMLQMLFDVARSGQ